jgi:hypothetical protein
MKIALDESVELEFDEWSLDAAGDVIRATMERHSERADDVLRAMLTILLFSQIEDQKPGTLERFNGIVQSAARTLGKP